MKHQVFWSSHAERQLAEIWLKAPDQTAVAAAADRIDAALRVNPLKLGESREGISRIVVDVPLSVLFRVWTEDRRVQVTSVWLHRPPHRA